MARRMDYAKAARVRKAYRAGNAQPCECSYGNATQFCMCHRTAFGGRSKCDSCKEGRHQLVARKGKR